MRRALPAICATIFLAACQGAAAPPQAGMLPAAGAASRMPGGPGLGPVLTTVRRRPNLWLRRQPTRERRHVSPSACCARSRSRPSMKPRARSPKPSAIRTGKAVTKGRRLRCRRHLGWRRGARRFSARRKARHLPGARPVSCRITRLRQEAYRPLESDAQTFQRRAVGR